MSGCGWHLSISENGDFHLSDRGSQPTVMGNASEIQMEMARALVEAIAKDSAVYARQKKELELAGLKERVKQMEAELAPGAANSMVADQGPA
jgi:hypothetical protein